MVIECSDALDVSLAADFKSLLQQAMAQSVPIVIDASKLERIDGAGLQLLAAFFIETQESGLNAVWKEPSEPLLNAARLSGLKEILHL